MTKLYNVAIIGKKGYVGRELTGLVQRHPHLALRDEASLSACIQNIANLQLIFLATPAPISMEAAATLMDLGVNIIDLSGAFRLPESLFKQWYQLKHTAPFLIEKACYGLSPWMNAQSQFQLIANPGCYATAALMALLPLVKANIVDPTHIIIDAKSGVSGAGKEVNPDLMFCEIANNFYPYKIGSHQHIPEIENALAQFALQKTKLSLTTSILPVVRGISLTIYLQVALSSLADDEIAAAILDAYQKAYASYPLIHYKEVGKGQTDEERKVLALNQVIHTPYCHIGFFVKQGQIILFSAIDNLLKGAASQAIENLNARYQLPLETGLTL